MGLDSTCCRDNVDENRIIKAHRAAVGVVLQRPRLVEACDAQQCSRGVVQMVTNRWAEPSVLYLESWARKGDRARKLTNSGFLLSAHSIVGR